VEPAELPDLNGAPVMVIAGQHDDRMPPGAGEHLARLLGRAGASVELGIADAGHELTPPDFAAGKGWFTRVLGG
jgi:predicted esterase